MKTSVGFLGLFLALLAQSSGAFAGYKIIGPEIDPLALQARASTLDVQVHLETKAKALKSLVETSGTGLPYEEYHQRTSLFTKTLHCFESAAAGALPALRTALENPESVTSEKYHTSQGLLESYNFLRHEVETEEELTFVRDNFPTFNLSQSEWSKLAVIQKQIKENADKTAYVSTATLDEMVEHLANPEFLKDLRTAVELIEKIVQDGDTVVAVGNTPQYILSALKHSKKNLELLTVAISGWPGIHKPGRTSTWFTDLVTQRGLDHYRKYLHDTGFLSKKARKRVFFLDIIGGGGGVEFLIHQLRHYSEANGQAEPDMNVIAINDIGNKMKGRSIEVDAYSLQLNGLGQKLDRMSGQLRVTIGLNAWKWDQWRENPLLLPATEGAKRVIQIIDGEFSKAYSPSLPEATSTAPAPNRAIVDPVMDPIVVLVDRPDLKITKTYGSPVHLGNTYDVKIRGYENLSQTEVFNLLKTSIPGIGQDDELVYESGRLVMNVTRHKALGAQMTKEEHESCFYSVDSL